MKTEKHDLYIAYTSRTPIQTDQEHQMTDDCILVSWTKCMAADQFSFPIFGRLKPITIHWRSLYLYARRSEVSLCANFCCI